MNDPRSDGEPDAGAAWARVDAALDRLIALPAAQRDAAIEQLAVDDPALAAELRSLVGGLAATDSVLDHPAAELLVHTAPVAQGLAAGTRLGPWRILGVLGRGGMGEVYRAERADGQFEQQVAIKLMRIDGAADLARFQQERQILARLDHPGIARLIDGDVDAEGRPYMVMEFVGGRHVIDWCAEHAPSLERRLALFADVCDAVAYAHRNLVVHGDLKPANVLVTPEGRSKLLDFGIARLLDRPAGDATSTLMLSPGYAAPEQLAGGAITTAADVHALGLLLHELLCGRPAHAVQHLSLAAAMQQVMTQTPFAPSRVARDLVAPPVPAVRLVGDLDAIVAKALRKEPEQRYASVDELSTDVARFLRHEPVRARRGGWTYIAGRALRRHRAWAIAGSLALLALAGGTGVVAGEARVARDEAARATAVKNFLTEIFKATDPRIASDQPRGAITARTLLDHAAARVEQDFAQQPALQIELLGLLAEIYGELREIAPYEAVQARRQALAHQAPGRFTQAELEIELNQASDAIALPDLADARRHLAAANQLLQRRGGGPSSELATWWLYTGDALERTQLEQREHAYREALAQYTRVNPRHNGRPVALSRLGALQYERGDLAGAMSWFQQAMVAHRASDNRNDAEVQLTLGSLGIVLANLGRDEEAAATYGEASALALRTHGEHEAAYWWSEAQRARLLHALGRREEADALYEHLLTLAPFPPTGSDGWTVFINYSLSLAAEGNPARALHWAEEIERNEAKTPYESHTLRAARQLLGDLYDQLGHDDDAQRALRLALDDNLAHMAAGRLPRSLAIERYARWLVGHGDAAQARRWFEQVLVEDAQQHSAAAALARAGLARVALLQHDNATASREADLAQSAWHSVTGRRDVRMGVYIQRVHAQALLAAGDAPAARELALQALADSQRYDAPGAASITEARALLQQAQSSSTTATH